MALLGSLRERRLSISLFSATFGLSTRPTEIGFKRYSTLLLPKWMTRLADHRRSGELMAERSPNTAIPGLYLASSYAGGGFTGAIMAGAAAAEAGLADRLITAST